MNLALYGGSFDPPHIGHVTVALEALRILPIDRLILVPAARNPFKTTVYASGRKRIEWLRQIFARYDKIEISDFEIAQGRSVPTIETVQHYRGMCDKLYLIIGADNLAALPQWHRFEELDAMVEWVVASRDGIPIPDGMVPLHIDVPFSSTDFRVCYGALGLESELESEIITYYKELHESKN